MYIHDPYNELFRYKNSVKGKISTIIDYVKNFGIVIICWFDEMIILSLLRRVDKSCIVRMSIVFYKFTENRLLL